MPARSRRTARRQGATPPITRACGVTLTALDREEIDTGGDTVPATPGGRTQVGRPASEPASAETVAAQQPATGDDLETLPAVDPQLYAIGLEIGRGGMGRVLAARDRKLRRSVVIKLLRAQGYTARFEREALITARLQHPSIVRVYDAGSLGGEPFYAMEHVRGKTLDRVVAEAEDAKARLALLPRVIAIADALAYAHSEGVIHRDLKPANVLIGEFGETVVIDWGLAKDLRYAGAESLEPERRVLGPRDSAPPAVSGDLTVAGAVMGTPSYMPPEQARGERADERSDVYAIGAILYTVIAGTPPVSGERALDDARAGGITPLRDRAPEAPEELVTIVEHAMAFDPAERYATARALADDLRRFAAGQLVARHAYTRGDLVRRWLRRYRAPLVVATAVLAVVGAFAAVEVRRLTTERDAALREAAHATASRRDAEDRGDELVLHQAERALPGDPSHAIAWLGRLSLRGLESDRARLLAGEAARRGVAFELVGPRAAIGRAVAVGATAYTTAGTELWRWQLGAFRGARLGEHAGEIHALAVSGDGFALATGGADRTIQLWDLHDMRHRPLAGHTAAVRALAFSPDGNTLASAGDDGSVRLWNAITGEAKPGLARLGPLRALAWSGDGMQLWAAGDDGQVHALGRDGVASGPALVGLAGAIRLVAVAPDGRRLAGAGERGAVVWTLGDRRARVLETTAVRDLVWAPGGALVIATGDAVRIHDATGHARVIAAAGASALALAPDGRTVAIAGLDGKLRLAPVEHGEPRSLLGHRQAITGIAFTQGGETLVSASGDRLRLWPLAAPPPVPASAPELETWLRARTNLTVTP
jgi:eukaryotic-like serine/threonine-protein kinase